MTSHYTAFSEVVLESGVRSSLGCYTTYFYVYYTSFSCVTPVFSYSTHILYTIPLYATYAYILYTEEHLYNSLAFLQVAYEKEKDI